MSRTLTASDRSRLIKLASGLPKGSSERKAILAGITKAAASYPSIRLMTDKEKAKLERWIKSIDYLGWTYAGRGKGGGLRLTNPQFDGGLAYIPSSSLKQDGPRHNPKYGWILWDLEGYEGDGYAPSRIKRFQLYDKLAPAPRHHDDRHVRKYLLDVSSYEYETVIKEGLKDLSKELKRKAEELSPQEALDKALSDPSLLIDVIPAASLPILSNGEFKSMVKKMGNLSRYPQNILEALLEGRRIEYMEGGTDAGDAALRVLAKKYLKRFTTIDGDFTLSNLIVKNGEVSGDQVGFAYGETIAKPIPLERGDKPGVYQVTVDTTQAPGPDWEDNGTYGFSLDKGTARPSSATAGKVSLSLGARFKTPLSKVSRDILEGMVEEAAQG